MHILKENFIYNVIPVLRYSELYSSCSKVHDTEYRYFLFEKEEMWQLENNGHNKIFFTITQFTSARILCEYWAKLVCENRTDVIYVNSTNSFFVHGVYWEKRDCCCLTLHAYTFLKIGWACNLSFYLLENVLFYPGHCLLNL